MAWYAYCISEKQGFPQLSRHRKPIPMSSLTGIAGNQVFLYPASDLITVVSEHDSTQALDQKAAIEHARVIGDCFHQATVLPFRFGTVFADEDALRKSIRSNHRQFLSNLEQLRGKAEMHIKVYFEDKSRERCAPAVTESTGREYLSNLRESASRQRERQTKARAVSVQMHRMFSPLREEVCCRRMDSGKMLLDIAHLIESTCIERYQNRYSNLVRQMKDCTMQFSGPWPPYHFVQRPVHQAQA